LVLKTKQNYTNRQKSNLPTQDNKRTKLVLGLRFFLATSLITSSISHVAQSCYSVIGDKPFLRSKPKFDPP